LSNLQYSHAPSSQHVPRIHSGRGARRLLLAAWWGHEAVVELLITAEADVNKTTPTTPLNAAANGVGWRHAPAVVKLLIEAGADVDKVGAGGATPLSCAAWVGRGQHLVPPGSPFTSPSQDLIFPVLSFPVCATSTSRLFTALYSFRRAPLSSLPGSMVA
jgi:hypothetical protein